MIRILNSGRSTPLQQLLISRLRDHPGQFRNDHLPFLHTLRTSQQRRTSVNTRVPFIDRTKIVVKAGNGGPGCASFLKGPNREVAPPDGGNGGRGGSVWMEASTSCTSLHMPTRNQRAESGHAGASTQRNGRNGQDLVLRVPCGTVVREHAYFEDEDLEDHAAEEPIVVCELNVDEQRALVAKGGYGGRGNCAFKSSTNRSPLHFEPGESGETRRLELELKTIADVGLVGFPNAGKSTLLRSISHAKPKVAAYPFTTLRPHIGVVNAISDDADAGYLQSNFTVADIPGLIEGAHENRGLGHEFLRHIERTLCIVYVLDLSSDQRVLLTNYEILRKELELHQEGLSSRKSCIVANKMDSGSVASLNLVSLLRAVGDSISVFPTSAKYGIGSEELVRYLSSEVMKS